MFRRLCYLKLKEPSVFDGSFLVQRFYNSQAPIKKTMLKKILILPVGFLLTTFLYISCCKCVEVKEHFYELKNASVKPLGSGGQIIDNGVAITADTVYLNYSFIPDCVARQNNKFSFLVNAAYACSCIGCGDKGLKSKLNSIEITSDNVFNGMPANSSLNSFFKVQKDFYSNISYSIDSLVSTFNAEGSMRNSFSVFTKTKPGNTAGHKLKLTMRFANSTTVEVTANPIIWQ